MSDNLFNGPDAQLLVTLLEASKEVAKQNKHKFILPTHLFLVLLNLPDLNDIISTSGGTPKFIQATLQDFLENNNDYDRSFVSTHVPTVSQLLLVTLQRAAAQAMTMAPYNPSNSGKILNVYSILHSMLVDDNSIIVKLLANGGSDVVKLRQLLLVKCMEELKAKPDPRWPFGDQNYYPESKIFVRHTHTDDLKMGKTQQSQQSNKNSTINDFCINLTNLAYQGKLDPVIGRETEVESVIEALNRKIKRNAILVGDAGVGKSAIVNGLAQRVVNGEVPESLQNIKIYELDVSSLIAGAKYRGEFEERLKNLMNELELIPEAVLFIDEIHTIKGSGAGSDNALDFSNILKPALSKGTIRVIGATTTEEYKKYFENDKALVRRFYKITVDEPSKENAIKIINGLVKRFEEFHHIKYQEGVVDEAINLSIKYMHNKKLPDKAIDLIDAAGARSKIFGVSEVSVDDIRYQISKLTNIPEQNLNDENVVNLQNLPVSLKQKIFGQDEIIDQIVQKIYLSKSGLRDESKPILSSLFQGPTGVGKTELSKQLAHEIGVEFIRFDMSEYQEKHSIAKLIGAPPGYVGYDEGSDGMLINAVEKTPNCVLLLDEVEKAHPDVLNILLQIMDYGMLTSNKDKKVSFRNVILIMTSNLGALDAERAKQPMGFAKSENDASIEAIDRAVKEFFKPEFRNRLDLIVKFNKLNREMMSKVVSKFIVEMSQKLLDKKILVTLTDAATDLIIDLADKENLGARPVASLIEKLIKQPISIKLLFGNIKEGTIIKIDVDNDNNLHLDYIIDPSSELKV